MSNSSFKSENATLVMSLDELLESLGYTQWITVTSTFVMPLICLIGLVLCSMSAFLFFHFRSKFKEPMFFYYRLLCVIYLIQLVHCIPFGLLSSNRYFRDLDTYLCATYLFYYTIVNLIFFHFEETLQMGILLDRMKIFSPFVRRHFPLSPTINSLVFFAISFLINFPLSFGLNNNSFVSYSYFDSMRNQTVYGKFYQVTSSAFSLTPFGQILLAFTGFFLNLFVTLVVGVSLNVISVCQYKSYIR